MGIGINIRSLRTRAGLTQERLALKIGVTPSAVGNYERDVSFPKEDVLLAMFDALDCSPNELFGETGYPEAEAEHLRKYKSLDRRGKERVDACTEIELERCARESDMVLIAARNGGPARKIELKQRGKKTIFDVPGYRGGRW